MSDFIAENFFVIASDNFHEIASRIYGYVIKENKMYHNYIFPSEVPSFSEEDIGYYSLINVGDREIEISMDAMGYGLVYYYNSDQFWAASNSFYKLMTYLKTRVKLSFDEEYGYLFSGVPHYGTITHERSLVKEIKLLALNEKIIINKEKNKLEIEQIQYQPIVKINTPEGMRIIDQWVRKWIRVIRQLVASGQCVNVQLSGGFDSRFVMALVLAAGVDMSKINIESSVTMKDDLVIAEQIGLHYNFKLNSGPMQKQKRYGLGLQTIIDANIFARLGNHKEFLPYNHYIHYEQPVFMFGGYGCMRCWFQDSTDGFIRFCYRDCIDTKTSKAAIAKVCEETFAYVDKRFNYSITRKSNFLNYTYNYGKGRYNYGTSIQILGAGNQFMCAPLADPSLIRIDPIFNGNDDYDILYSYVLNRFAPDLLNFPINGNRCFKEESVKKAKKLSESCPLSFDLDEKASVYPMQIFTSYSPEYVDGKKRNCKAENYFDLFLSNSENREIYTSYYGDERYDLAMKACQEKKGRHYERDAFGILAVVEAIKACRLSSELDADLNHFDGGKYLADNKSCIAVYGSAKYARFLGQNNVVYSFSTEKLDNDKKIEEYLKNSIHYIIEMESMKWALESAEYMLIAADKAINECDIEDLVSRSLRINSELIIVFINIPCTIGFVDKMTEKYGQRFIVSAPIFKASSKLCDSLFKKILYLGVSDDGHLRSKAKKFGQIVQECSVDQKVSVSLLKPERVEALLFFGD